MGGGRNDDAKGTDGRRRVDDMTTRGCFDIEELERIGQLAPGDPRRDHLDGCARCQSRRHALELFLRGEAEIPGARMDLARSGLDAFLEERFGPVAAESRRAERSRPAARSRWLPWAGRWRIPALIAVPAAVVVAALVLIRPDGGPGGTSGERPDRTVWRGSGDGAAWIVHPPQTEDGRGVRLSWSRVGEADRYHVRVMTSSLAPLFESGDLADTLVIVPRETLRPPQGVLGPREGTPPPAEPLFFRVVAMRETRELQRSELIEIVGW